MSAPILRLIVDNVDLHQSFRRHIGIGFKQNFDRRAKL
jgi:hypothetical protein